MIKTGGILGTIILFLDIWAILKIIQGPNTTFNKAIWIAIILLLPAIGLILWWFFRYADREDIFKK